MNKHYTETDTEFMLTAKYIAENSKPLPKEFAQVIDEDFDELIDYNGMNNERERNI